MLRSSASRDRLLESAQALIWTRSYYGTSVDEICERSQLKKGSFYHHFESKEALTIEAIDQGWARFRQRLDEAFSASHPPLERFRIFARQTLEAQRAMQAQVGKVLGCPLFSLGTEVGTLEPLLRERIDQHLKLQARYYESAILEAQQRAELPAGDAAQLALQLLSFSEGALSLARIRNDLAPVEALESGFMKLLRPGAASLAN